MPEFEVKTQFVFTGVFKVKADNRQQAKEYVDKNCGLVLGRNIHSSLPDEDIDWDFAMHPEKKIKSVTKQ